MTCVDHGEKMTIYGTAESLCEVNLSTSYRQDTQTSQSVTKIFNMCYELKVSLVYCITIDQICMLLLLALCRKLKLEDAYQHHRFVTDAKEHVSIMCCTIIIVVIITIM